MSSEERMPKSTLPIQEAIGCEMFMLLYVFHIIYWKITADLYKPLIELRYKILWDIRINVLPNKVHGLALRRCNGISTRKRK